MFIVEVEDFRHWRKLARELLTREISPHDVAWQEKVQGELALDFSAQDKSFFELPRKAHKLAVPRQFFDIAKNVACFRDKDRWALLYSIAWRLVFEDRRLLAFTVDSQVSKLLAMNKSIGRDKHKMEAFVRFRLLSPSLNEIADDDKNNSKTIEQFVAWFEPEHPILPIAASFFVKRFHNMRWSILTPDACAHWNLERLTFTEGVPRPHNIEDQLEELWLQYYAHIFNPARLKLKAMQAEMPKKYWQR